MKDFAVIDVGSNSVRLVIYAITNGQLQPWFNEKVQAGLGRNLDSTGLLCRDGADKALLSLSRYALLLEAHSIETVLAFATGAVRDASDGMDFVNKVKAVTDLELRVLSGEEEARYAALGVASAFPQADGIVGDLGGWSLELSRLERGTYIDGSTCAAGPLALSSLATGRAMKVAQKRIRATKNLSKASTLYICGGAWRDIARIDMELRQWPIRSLQYYEMSSRPLRRLLRDIYKRDALMLQSIRQISPRREEYIPYAAIALDVLISVAGIKRIIVSTSSVREGLAREQFYQNSVTATGFAGALAKWLSVIPDLPGSPLLEQACILSRELLVPHISAEAAFELAINIRQFNLPHQNRAALALAIACAKRRKFRHPATAILLQPEMHRAAPALGAMIRLGNELSGQSSEILSRFKLGAPAGKLKLTVSDGDACLVSETVERQLAQAAELLGRKPLLKKA